ncbi:peptidyl-prolyl cis-trans isomerase [Rhodobacteraceae bacterium NNCM2]|nr:peptidyl-prolyl cis-trans isomerase [Coraliihabitans acroporae]
MTENASANPKRAFAAILRDPLTHFLIAGAFLFAAYAAFAPTEPEAPSDAARIEVTEDDLRQIALVLLAQGQRLPGPEQFRELARQEAIQRILVREAKALGLDQDDEVIERRLAQKMDFLLADLATLTDPTDEELRAWYARNIERFSLPPRVSFRHLYFSHDDRGPDGALAAAAETLPRLGGIGPDDPALAGMADPFMFRDYYGGRTPLEIAKEFGPQFSEAAFASAPGRWSGPVQSGYGWHLVWLDTLEPGRPADYETVRDSVRAAWLEERHREIRDRAYAEMLSRYTIIMPDPETIDLSRSDASASGSVAAAALE